MEIVKIRSQKNNKIRINAHILWAMKNKKIVGRIIRIEAESWGRLGNTNQWDVFFSDNEKIAISPRSSLLNTYVPAICKYDGVEYIPTLKESVETPLGPEVVEVPLMFIEVPFSHAGPEDVEVAKETTCKALREGFGPHGRLKYEDQLKLWVMDRS